MMRTAMLRCSTVALVVALAMLALPATAQPGPPPGGQGGFGGPGMGPGMGGPMGPPPMPMSPPVTMMIADGVVYVACNGTLTAYQSQDAEEQARAGDVLDAAAAAGRTDGAGRPAGPAAGWPAACCAVAASTRATHRRTLT